MRDYDYGGTSLLRATRTTYQNSTNYTGTCYSSGCVGRHIFNLLLSVEVYAADYSTRMSRTEYQYDGQPLSATPNVVQHDQAFNPHAADEGFCYWDYDWSDGDCNGSCMPNCWECIQDPSCDGYCPQIYYCPYDSSTDFRGNVTQVTSYADALNLAGAVTEPRRYDVTGNMVTASTSCCQQTSFNFTIDTQYAYPLSKTRGSATDAYAQVTTSVTYDFYTGLGKTATDANGRPSTTDYDANTLRPTTSTSPTGAHTDFAYNDAAMTVTSTTYPTAGTGGAIADQNVKLVNGQGQVRQEKALGANNTWDFVDTIYDNMRQVSQQTKPYRSGETQRWSAVTYDALGRTKTVTAPDGSVSQTFYNEATRPSVASNSPGETTRVQDAWGRERWGRTDSSGRLVEVVEPDPGGNGSVASNGMVTTYSYNTLGNLVTVNQNPQTRSFKYDSLGRLTAQKLAEASATLNDAGTYVSSGTWSDVFTYDERSNLTSRTDARGVKTVYSYNSDPLNRLQSVSWDMSGFGDLSNPILPAATVTYQYRNRATNTTCDPTDSSGRKDVTQMASISTSGISSESQCYDTEGRVSSKTLTLSSRSSYPFVTDYAYDTLDRVSDVRYPAEYGNGSAPRKVVHQEYDIASRLTGLTFDSQSFASSIVYNAASQTTSLNAGTGTNQVSENYAYNAQTGLLDSQTVVRGSTTLLNLSYDYTNANGKRTGQLTKILNNLDHNKDRGFSYDALGRLTQATGGPSSSLWTQSYSYDRYGNRTSVTASGYSAANKSATRDPKSAIALASPAEPRVELPTETLARNNNIELPEFLRDNDGRPVSDSPPRLRAAGKDATRSADADAHAPVASMPQGTGKLNIIGATASNFYGPGNEPSRAFDGDPNSFWNSGDWPQQWIQLDLGQSYTLSKVRLLVAQLPNANTTHQIYGGATTDNLRLLWTLDGATQDWQWLEVNTGASNIRYLKVLTTSSPSWVAWRELEVYGSSGGATPIATDGLSALTYDQGTNHITTAGFAYDAAGNQTRALIPGGSASQRFQYDAANRMVKVKADDNSTVLATYTYGDSNERLIADEGGYRTYYDFEGGIAISEYTEADNSIVPGWSKSYVYLGNRLLSTLTPNGSGGEAVEFDHPDRLGTRIVTNPSTGTSYEQVTLPFGTPLNAESTGATNRRFTTYDRSSTTGLDYALNRHYDSQQGRFTQVDPAGMKAASLLNPQTLNLYAYCSNDPVNRTDRDGLGLISWIKKHWKIILIAVAVVVAVLLIPGAPAFLASFFQHAGTVVLGASTEGGGLSTTLKIILGASFAFAIAALGTYLQNRQVKKSSSDPLQDALDRARKALERKACRDLFGSQTDKVLEWLDKFVKNTEGVGSIKMVDMGGVNPRTGKIAFGGVERIESRDAQGFLIFHGFLVQINSNPAVNGPQGYNGRFGQSNEVNRAITLLHELAHAIDFLVNDGTSQIVNDQDQTTDDLSKKNSEKVFNACFK